MKRHAVVFRQFTSHPCNVGIEYNGFSPATLRFTKMICTKATGVIILGLLRQPDSAMEWLWASQMKKICTFGGGGEGNGVSNI